MSVREIQLTPAEFDLTVEKIAKLNQRAVKRGWTGSLVISGKQVEVIDTLPSGLRRTRSMVDATITGDAPKYDGWTFLAKVEWSDGGMVLFTAPGIEGIDRSGITEGSCDHCGIDRYRKNTYIVRNDDGRQLQVGSTCLKDFLGWSTNPVWVSIPSDSDLFGEGGYGYADPDFSVETVLAASWAAIQKFGYVRASDGGNATKYVVSAILNPTPKERKFSEDIQPFVSKAASMAHRIREFLLSDEFSGNGEYVLNLKNVASGEFVSPKFFGLLVSAPQAWAKAQERSLIRQRETAETVNEFIGTVADKLELTVTLKSIRFIDGNYGTITLYTFRTDTGHVVKWFASSGPFGDSELDKEFRIKGTVKKHDTYQGSKSTVLTRVKAL